jgi:hypothetical protein
VLGGAIGSWFQAPRSKFCSPTARVLAAPPQKQRFTYIIL